MMERDTQIIFSDMKIKIFLKAGYTKFIIIHCKLFFHSKVLVNMSDHKLYIHTHLHSNMMKSKT